MSSFYEDASLVMIPSGYKTSKVYSAKPTDGAGDLVFTRSNDTATRVNSAGLIEKVRTNLLTYSQAFDNAAYNKGTGGSVSANTVIAPDGTTTADAYTFASSTSTFAYLSHQASSTSTLPHTFSIYIKRPTGSGSRTLRLVISDVTTTTGISSNFTITESWQRFEFTRTSGSSTGLVGIGFALASSGVSIAAGEVLDIWGAQLETGDIATDYIATTSAAVSVGPVANVPRLDYLGSSCPRLILEPQRTNAITFSESFDNAAWSKLNATISANAATSPDGYTNADFIIPTVTNGIHSVFSGASVSSGTHTLSVFAKKGVYKNLLVWFDGHSGGVDVNLDTLAVFRDQNNSGYKIENYGNGWVRISVTCTVSVASPPNFYIYDNSATPVISWAGNGTDGLYMWGAQLEAGAYATSYIPTLGAAVTRGEDIARTASGVTSIFNSTWTAFGELVIPAQGSPGVATGFGLKSVYGSDNIANWVLGVAHSISSASSVDFVFYVSGVSVKTVTQAITYGMPFKFAVTSDGVVYVNGVEVSASSSLTPATPVEFGFGRLGQTNFSNGEAERVAQALLFKSILPPADAIALTA